MERPARQDLTGQVAALPDQPGVYLLRDGARRLLYVGKAVSLRTRVGHYFQTDRARAPRTAALVGQVRAIEHIVTRTADDALLLEASLIREHQPKYNVLSRDDKRYPLLKLTVQEPFPRLLLTRRRLADGARYFGPYTNVRLLRRALRTMRRLFPLRTCGVMPDRVCLEFHLWQCLGPCEGRVEAAAYQDLVREVALFLEGKRDALLTRLHTKMAQAAAAQRYEEAARVRDQIEALTDVSLRTQASHEVDEILALRDALDLPRVPRRIEAVDISNLSGQAAVGSVVVFVDGRPWADGYRRFRIKGVTGVDDYRMIREVVHRRYARVLREGGDLPDLLVIDGGAGQLSSARAALEAVGAGQLPTIGLAKEFERIHRATGAPLLLPADSLALRLLQRVRDEAHRFAVSYHRRLRHKRALVSVLDEVPGIGARRRGRLLTRFGSLEEIQRATLDDLMSVGLPRALAETVQHVLATPPAPGRAPHARRRVGAA